MVHTDVTNYFGVLLAACTSARKAREGTAIEPTYLTTFHGEHVHLENFDSLDEDKNQNLSRHEIEIAAISLFKRAGTSKDHRLQPTEIKKAGHEKTISMRSKREFLITDFLKEIDQHLEESDSNKDDELSAEEFSKSKFTEMFSKEKK